MTRPIRSPRTGTRLARTLAIAALTGLATFGLVSVAASAQAASQAYPAVTVWNAGVITDTPGKAVIDFDYKLTDDTPPGLFMVSLYTGPKTSDAGWLDTTGISVTEPGTQHHSETRSLDPGTYTLRIQSKLRGCDDEHWRDCYGEVKAVDDIVFTVQAEPTPTPTPTPAPTDTPTPEPTATIAPAPEPTASATPAPTPTATLASASLSTSTVTPGGQVTVTGRGYAPGEAVELWLHSNPVKLATLSANSDGTFSRTVTIPIGTEAGAHHIEVRDATNGTVSLNLTVVAGLAVTGVSDGAATTGLLLAVPLVGAGVGLMLWRRRRVSAHTSAMSRS